MTREPPLANSLPRLLLGAGEPSLRSHRDTHGPLPDLRRIGSARLIESVRAAGLRGRGGAAFPVAMKLQAVASRRGRRTVVLANGSEGEPASKKDRVLLRELPNLVLDGVATAAAAVGAHHAVIALHDGDPRSSRALERAIAERLAAGLDREARVGLVLVPRRYITGQEAALINFINTGTALPTFGSRPFERGIDQQPTLVQNVETLAHLTLIARHDAGWFRQLGTSDDPGSALVTVSGAVRAPGVYEIAQGTPLTDVLDLAGAENRLGGVLIGGYFGSWVEPERVPRLLLSRDELAPHGASLGAGVIAVLGERSCGVAETVRVADYLAAEGAGQCGPCVNGLSAIADTLRQMAGGIAPPGAQRDLERWCRELPRRGACAHPDGAVRFVASALRVFASEFAEHARRGRCGLCSAQPVLPTPSYERHARAA